MNSWSSKRPSFASGTLVRERHPVVRELSIAVASYDDELLHVVRHPVQVLHQVLEHVAAECRDLLARQHQRPEEVVLVADAMEPLLAVRKVLEDAVRVVPRERSRHHTSGLPGVSASGQDGIQRRTDWAWPHIIGLGLTKSDLASHNRTWPHIIGLAYPNPLC